MDWKSEWKKLAAIAAVFLAFFWLPVEMPRFSGALMESFHLAKWYAREHVLLCLVPAFFIAGAIGVFISQAAVMKYLGPKAGKILSYGVASVSGSVLAVCSCTVLPLFSGIWKMGAGLGPACAFLYSGPAINVLAIIMTARILGADLGAARAIGAIGFSIIIGLVMHFLFRKEEAEKAKIAAAMPEPEVKRPLWKNALFFAAMIGVLVFANWGAPNDFEFKLVDGSSLRAAVLESPEDPSAADASLRLEILDGSDVGKEILLRHSDIKSKEATPGTWKTIWQSKWIVTAAFAVFLAVLLAAWFDIAWWKLLIAAAPPAILSVMLPGSGLWVLIPFSAGILGFSIVIALDRKEGGEWFGSSWTFAKQILPLLFFGVLVAGFLLGRPGHEGLIPGVYVEMLVGDRPDRFLEITGMGGGGFESFSRAVWPFWTNLFAAVFGAFMYFATLTEVPILQGLMGAGMGKGPALALLLAGPALSLPNMLVIHTVMGTKKTVTFISLVIGMAWISGLIFGLIAV